MLVGTEGFEPIVAKRRHVYSVVISTHLPVGPIDLFTITRPLRLVKCWSD